MENLSKVLLGLRGPVTQDTVLVGPGPSAGSGPCGPSGASPPLPDPLLPSRGPADPVPKDPVPEPEPESGGFGLAAMRARVQDLGGTFTVRSGDGEGTAITAVLPLPSEQPSERHP